MSESGSGHDIFDISWLVLLIGYREKVFLDGWEGRERKGGRRGNARRIP